MKDFIKTMGSGILVIFTAFISVIAIAAAFVDLFVSLPEKTGFIAVVLFVFALVRLLIGGVLIYVLGGMFESYKEV